MFSLSASEIRKALCKQKFGRNWTKKIGNKIGRHPSTVSRTVQGKSLKKNTAFEIYLILVDPEFREEYPFERIFPEFETHSY